MFNEGNCVDIYEMQLILCLFLEQEEMKKL